MTPLVTLDQIQVHFTVNRRTLRAVENVSLDIAPGETLALVGESGSGKSTLGNVVAGLQTPTAGTMKFRGKPVDRAVRKDAQKAIQIVFQDPFGALDPRMPVSAIIAEPLRIAGASAADQRARAAELVGQVGLPLDALNRYPHEFSGGQCQRIGIARALILEPKLIICDEPVSALDVSIRAQIVNLLQELQRRKGLALIFIAHDLAVVKHISDRVLVLYLGKSMELAQGDALYARPGHPYTEALLSAIPIPDPRIERGKVLQLLSGDMPSPIAPPSGCVFRTRCPKAVADCAGDVPALRALDAQTSAACILAAARG